MHLQRGFKHAINSADLKLYSSRCNLLKISIQSFHLNDNVHKKMIKDVMQNVLPKMCPRKFHAFAKSVPLFHGLYHGE